MSEYAELTSFVLDKLSLLYMDHKGTNDTVAIQNDTTVRHAQSIVTHAIREFSGRAELRRRFDVAYPSTCVNQQKHTDDASGQPRDTGGES